MEVLHADDAVAAVGGVRPPRPVVVAPVGRFGRVHVGTDRGHLALVEHADEMQVTGLGEEVRELRGVGVGREAATQIERRAVAIVEADGAARVDGPVVEDGAEDDPPVEELVEPPAREIELAGREERHRRDEVVDQIAEHGRVEAGDGRGVCIAGRDRESTAVERERPRAPVDLEREWPQRELARSGHGQSGTGREPVREFVREEHGRIDRAHVGRGARPEID